MTVSLAPYVCCCPVGLENIAFAFCLHDVRQHGDFLDQLLDLVHGFIILDLHNVYCQAMNFDVPADELLACYPLLEDAILYV